MVKIKKQYKQPDGTIIEVEGTEAEIEGFEKKQQKQKAQIEQSERKKTILYGKDLEEIRKIVREELAKQARPIVYEYRYYNPQPYPYIYQPGWSIAPAIYGASSTCGALNTTTDNKINLTTTAAEPNASQFTYTCGTAQGQANSISSMSSVVSSVLDAGSINVSMDNSSVQKLLGGNPAIQAGWSSGGSTSNFLMSPRT